MKYLALAFLFTSFCISLLGLASHFPVASESAPVKVQEMTPEEETRPKPHQRNGNNEEVPSIHGINRR
ncbi:hypothetical protein [Algicola sagamiensis]|uniref:hypothetical protein n=1 Tax=Algicola sagamiensis TaxID=163869 RepID=UPI0003767942|nr:hypothetical protein [Algicola sagamiensis]